MRQRLTARKRSPVYEQTPNRRITARRFTGDDVHAFLVILLIAGMIIGLAVKITFF